MHIRIMYVLLPIFLMFSSNTNCDPRVIMNGLDTQLGKVFIAMYGPLDSTVIERNAFHDADSFSDKDGVYYLLNGSRTVESYQYFLFQSSVTCDVYFIRRGGYFGITQAYGPIHIMNQRQYCDTSSGGRAPTDDKGGKGDNGDKRDIKGIKGDGGN